ncbi:MAG: hypothetical protein H6Q64_1741 [Firmicutes bacterium]|nr:hypothetical protein [Bacillota bacterium]
MLIIELIYVKPIEEVEQNVVKHNEFLDKYFEAGNFICSGRKNPRVGGIIICNESDQSEAERIIQEDPFFINKVADYNMIEFLPTKYADGFEKFIK